MFIGAHGIKAKRSERKNEVTIVQHEQMLLSVGI